MLASGAVSSLAVAQTPPDQPSGTIRVDVTGTNIRRVDSETPAPVQVITQEQMVREGYTTIAEVLRDVTANGQGLLSQGFSRAFAGGASGVALRGLGVGATLVLIDGLRMVPYPLADDAQRNFVDVSSIPFQAVDRIEVLLDGASAIYGSDAIGGVVNIILKKNFTGSQFVGDAGSTTEGGGTMWHASLTQGFGQSTDTVSGFLTFEYRHQDQIKLDQRSGDWTNFNWTSQGGQDIRPGAYAPNAGVSQPYILGAPYLQNRGQSTNNAANYAFLSNTCNFTAMRANQCVFTDTWSQIYPTTQNVNVVGRLNINLPGDWQAVLTGSWFDSYSQQTTRQTNLSAGSFAGNTVIGLNVPIPYISPPIAAYTVPTNYPGNPFGAPANVRAILPDVTSRETDFENQTTRLVATASGPAVGFDWTVAAGYQFSETDTTYRGYVAPYAMFAALNDPVHPYNLLGGNSSQVQGLVAPTVNKNPTNELDFLQFTATRDLMKLDGGPLGLALGGGGFYNRLYSPNPDAVSNGTVAGINAAYAAGSQTNWNFYGELSAPVLKTLELDAALRYDWYNTYGSQWTPKVGAKWTPIKEVGLRGTWGQGFRAPNPIEAGNSGSLFGFNAIRDPLLCPVSNPNGTPNLTSPQNVPAFCNFAPTYLQVSNPKLQAEKSDNWTVGLILEPIAKWLTTVDYYDINLKNQIIPIASTAAYNPLDFAVRTSPQQVTFGDGSTGLSSVGPIAFAASPFINAQTTTTTGLDLGSSYTFTLPDTSTFMVAAQWSHIFTYDITLDGVKYKLAGTHGPTIVSGDTGNPKDRFNITLQWAKGPWTITGLVNYVGSYDMTDPSVGIFTCQDGINANNGQRWVGVDAPSQYCNAGSFTWFNLNVQYQVNKQLMIQASGVNIFNAKPPVDMNTYAGTGFNLTSNQTGAPYNPSLHGPGAFGPVWSVGLVYNFDIFDVANQVSGMMKK
jgi:iron complex outermembrane receptor protein